MDKVHRGPVPDYRINILFGNRNDDRLHRELFQDLGWGRIYALANGDHSLPHELKEMGVLKEIALSALAGELSQARLDVILGGRRLLGKKKRRELKRNPRPPKPPKRRKVPKPPKPLAVRLWKRSKKFVGRLRKRLAGETAVPPATTPATPPGDKTRG